MLSSAVEGGTKESKHPVYHSSKYVDIKMIKMLERPINGRKVSFMFEVPRPSYKTPYY